MTNRLIKPYLQWVNEANDPGQPTATADAVVFISVASSASNITPNLAEKLGVKVDTKYKVEVANSPASGGLGRFFTLSSKDGSKFGTTIKITEVGAVAKGQDYLSINGKTITETGQFVLTKAEVQNGLIIEASNNGLLVLARLGDALVDMGTSYKIYLGISVNFAVRFSLGGKVGVSESTGFSYYWAKPGELNPSANLLGLLIAESALKLAGYDAAIAKSDPVAGGWSTAVDRWGIANVATELPKLMAKHLAGRKMLTDLNVAALQSWSAISANPAAVFTIPTTPGKKIKYTPTGLKLAKAVAVDLAKAITSKTVPAGFGAESNPVLASYSAIIIDGLSTPNIENTLDMAQAVQNWGPASAKPGGAGTGNANQGEGGFGQPKPAPVKG
jgi:hypothetical protein